MNAKPFVSTEELLGRLAEAPEVPVFLVLRKLSALVIALSVPFWLGLLFFGERVGPVAQDVSKVGEASNFPFSAGHDAAEVQLTIELDHPGSIFIDGRHLAMRSRCVTHLPRGRHVLLVHMRGAAFRRVLDVEDRPLRVMLDSSEKKLIVKEAELQSQVSPSPRRLPSRLLGR